MNKISLLLISALFFISCNNENNKADAYGNFEAVETIISAETSGKILEFNASEGNKYKAGRLIGIIDTTDLYLKKMQLIAQKQAVYAKIANIDAQINVQQEQLQTLQKETERIDNLLEGGAATSKQKDDVLAQKRLLMAQIEATKTQKKSVYSESNVLQKQIDQLQVAIQKCYLKIPANGTMLNKYVETFELVMPGKALYKLADLGTIVLRAYVSGNQLQQIKLGQEVNVQIDKNEKENIEFTGIISWISESAEFTPKIIQTKEERVDLVYALKVKVENNGQIKVGMPGELRF